MRKFFGVFTNQGPLFILFLLAQTLAFFKIGDYVHNYMYVITLTLICIYDLIKDIYSKQNNNKNDTI